MTLYEKLSLVVAFAALIVSIAIPSIRSLKKKFSKPSISVIPFDGRPLTVCFNESGSYVEFKFSLLCENTPCVVKTIEINVCNVASGKRMTRKWTCLKPINVSWANAGSQSLSLSSATYVHPVKLEPGKLEPLYVEFGLLDSLEQDALLRKRNEAVASTYVPGAWGASTAEDLLSSEKMACVVDEVSNSCFWESGSYEILLRVLYDSNSTVSERLKFDLSEEDAEVLRSNARGIVECGFPLEVRRSSCGIRPVDVSVRGF